MEEQRQRALELLKPDESAAEYLARTSTNQLSSGILFLDSRGLLRPTNVIEISGLAGTGKTELLYSIAAKCILPTTVDNINYGGHHSNVIFFDLDGKFDAVRMAHILQSRIYAAYTSRGLGYPPDSVVESVVYASVGRLHVIPCPSTFHFLAALKIVKSYALGLLERKESVAAILVDNVSAHYYVDKTLKSCVSSDGVMQSENVKQSRQGVWSLTAGRAHLAMTEGLRKLQHGLRAPIIATKHILGAQSSREMMLPPWPGYVTHRVVVTKKVEEYRGSSSDRGNGGTYRLAQWVKPPGNTEYVEFIIDSSGAR